MSANWFHRLLIAPLPYVPRPIVWQLSRRYIAGTDLDSAFDTVRALNAGGCSATLDVLGEDSTVRSDIEIARDLYLGALDGIVRPNLDCGISVKLSDMGLRFDADFCRQTMERILAEAAKNDIFVRIDMEDATVTTQTLDLYRDLHRSFDNLGTVIQAYLRRSPDDVRALLEEGRADLRLVKGIYVEDEAVALKDPDDIRTAFRELLVQMLEGGIERVAIATHDPALIEFAEQYIEQHAVDRSRYEFQMLLGVAENLRASLVAKGHPLRVYVPFGERWFAYSIRRLRENPEIAGHIVRNLFSRN